MPDNKQMLKAMWDKADETGDVVDIGKIVVCDICGEDFTDSIEEGGLIFSCNAYCPTCATNSLPKIRGYREDHFIRAICPNGVSFADFVRNYRGKGTIQVLKTSR